MKNLNSQYYFFVIIALQLNASLYTMTTTIRRLAPTKQSLRRSSATISPNTRTIVSSQQSYPSIGKRQYSSQQPTPPKIQLPQERASTGIFESMRQWWQGNPEDVIEQVKKDEYTSLQSLYKFIANNNQNNVNDFLDKLIINKTGDDGVIALDKVVDKIWWKLYPTRFNQIGWTFKPKVIMLRKLTDWTTTKLVDLLQQDFTKEGRDATVNFITRLFEYDIDQKIDPIIIEKLQDICQTDTGLSLIQHINWAADRAKTNLIEQDRSAKSQEKILGKDKRAYKLWQDILTTIQNDPQTFSPLLEKTYTGKNILSKVNKKTAREKATQTVKE